MTEALPKLAAPARRALASAGVIKLAQLADFREADIAQLHGMGPNALAVLTRALAASGRSFKS